MSRRHDRARKVVERDPDLTLVAVQAWDRRARRRVKRLGTDAAELFGPPGELDEIAALNPEGDWLRDFVQAKQHRLRTILGDVD